MRSEAERPAEATASSCAVARAETDRPGRATMRSPMGTAMRTTRPVTGSAMRRKTAAVIMPSTEAMPRPACWKDAAAVSASAEAMDRTSPEVRSAGRLGAVSAACVISTRRAWASCSRAALHRRAPKRYPTTLSTVKRTPRPMIEMMRAGIDSGMIARSTMIPIATGTSASHTCHTDSAPDPPSSGRMRRRAARRSSCAPVSGIFGTKATLTNSAPRRFGRTAGCQGGTLGLRHGFSDRLRHPRSH